MRLPNFDLTVLAVHYLFAAANGSTRVPAAEARPHPPPERIHDAIPFANATRAGLIDCRAPAPAHVVCHMRARAAPRRAPRALSRARRRAPETGPATHARASRATPAEWLRTWDALPACQKADLAQAIVAARRAGVDINACVASRAAASRAAALRWLTHPLGSSSGGASGPAGAVARADSAAGTERRGQDVPARLHSSGIDAELERGAVVYAENKLLGLGRDSDERRVAARIWRRAQEAPHTFPSVNPTLARRVAEDEDRVLASVCPPSPDGSCACS